MAKRCERWSALVVGFAVLDLIVLPSVARAVVPEPIFYLPLDGSATAVIAKGDPEPLFALHNDSILAIVDMQKRTFTQGKVGQGYQINETPLIFRCKGNFRPDEGTCSFWLNPDFRGDDTNIYCAFFGAGQWGMVYKYLSHTSLTFGTAKPDRDLYYDCSVGDITSWRPGEWHHVVVTWSRKNNERRIYVDGERAAQAPFPYHREVDNGFMYIGSGCELYPGRFAHAKMDEVAIWDCPLNDDEVRELYELGVSGTPVRKVEQAKKQEDLPAAANLQVVRPRTPAQPAGELPASRIWAAGETVALDGWWEFLPMPRPTSRLPDEGWGLSRVPGYWAMPGETIGPDGKPCAGTWQGKPYSEFAVGYYQRHFDAGQDWREVNVFLQIEGVDGLAEVFVNGHRLDWLPSWEYEAYDVGRVLRYGEENTVTIAVYTRANAQVAGIYGSVYLRLLPETFVNDVAVQPLVEKGQIRFSCDVWHGGEPTEGQIELCVAPAAAPEAIEKRFLHTCRLEKAPRDRPELSYQVQRVDMVFEWKDAHPWTVDDPFIYQVTARIATEKGAGQQSPPVRFGYREFRVRGADFVLNGKPIHLRGHQIDLGWRDQFERVKQLKLAGMNAFELSGPISCDWYARTPYQEELFENILNYADEHGLLAMPILPDAKVLKQRVFEPQVAALYRRRLDKHIRRYGNHPSVVMWYMHFNLAGYPWYIAPSKIDGSYKPTDAAWVERERYALEAERIAHEIDPRPIYHHACGALGSIFTANCYIGPTSPLQERAEWPSRWAEKRLFPLMACEHCLILIPYWFRLRKFPLSEVYASEPIFDELAAKYLGRKAYDVITPELFDLYDTGREPRSSRLMSLIRHHPGYQAVKSLVARESLRSWRTYGVSGIIFNAVNWDFFDDEGRPLPVLQALARYFGDTDMYVAGPEGDWPSKDHTFYAGETVRKQVVLINDLGRDIPCVLRWKLSDKARVNWQEGQIEALSRAGQVCFYPITFRAPSVNLRTTFTLSVEAVGEASMHFKPETFDIQVFPRAQPPAIRGKVLVFDTEGRTVQILKRMRIPYEILDEDTDPASASLVIVGRESYGERFLQIAKKVGVEGAVTQGTNLLVFEQTSGSPLGLRLEEQSARQVFVAIPDHPFLRGLAPEDFVNFRGQSDLMEAYPDAPAETERQWPKRFFKWGNRGIVASFVYMKPHYAPFVPILECGFDLVNSPLMEAKIGMGRVVLCQLDVTSRYGIDPVSTILVHNLLSELTQATKKQGQPCAWLGQSAQNFLMSFGIAAQEFKPGMAGVIVVADQPLSKEQCEALGAAARSGATVLLLPRTSALDAFGLRLREEQVIIGRGGSYPLLVGLNDGDTYLKACTQLLVVCPENGWEAIVEPGIMAVKKVGEGRIVACQLDPNALGNTRGRIKVLRFWNILFANLGVSRATEEGFLQPRRSPYEDNEWEQIPPYINW